MVQPYGFASRKEGNCTASIECGQTFDDNHKWCCPTSSTCQTDGYDRVCCDSSSSFAVCLNRYIGAPVCANSSYTLYDNAGYFCCNPESIGMRVIRGNEIHSFCGARTGFTVENATILQPLASQGSDKDGPFSSFSRGSKQPSAAATAGIAIAAILFVMILAFAFFWWRRRKAGLPSGVLKARKGDSPLTATTPKPSVDWEKDVAMQNMPMAQTQEPLRPAPVPSQPSPVPFVRDVTHFELPTDTITRTSEAEPGWTEMPSQRDSRLPTTGADEISTVRNSRSTPSPTPPAVPPKNSAVSPTSPVWSGRTLINEGATRGEPRTS